MVRGLVVRDGPIERGGPIAGRVMPRPSITTLKRRREFLACARARRQAMPGLVLQARRRPSGEIDGQTAAPTGTPGRTGAGGAAGGPASAPADPIRVGYTCSKKVGGAVVRNRAKRRLRAAAAEVLPNEGTPGWDYVLIGRRDATVARPFSDLVADLRGALGRVHARR